MLGSHLELHRSVSIPHSAEVWSEMTVTGPTPRPSVDGSNGAARPCCLFRHGCLFK